VERQALILFLALLHQRVVAVVGDPPMALLVDQVVVDGVRQVRLLIQVVLEIHHQLHPRKVTTVGMGKVAVTEWVVVVAVLEKQATQMDKLLVAMVRHQALLDHQ
jgi:hypothetical protein